MKPWIFGMFGAAVLSCPLGLAVWAFPPCPMESAKPAARETCCPTPRTPAPPCETQPRPTLAVRGQPTLAPPLALVRATYGQVIEVEVEVEQATAEEAGTP